MSVEQGSHRYGIVLGQRMSWRELLVKSVETEELGFDNLFFVDHFYGLKDLDDPTHEGYTALAAVAPHTSRVRLGIMVCGNTYRNPAFLLKQAITVDHVSDGRLDFGVGAGWVEREHEAYSWEFPSAKERVDRFAEALEIWELLQSRDRTTYRGQHYTLIDAPFQPKSLQGQLPLLIGGSGPRMMALTAKYADMWNGVGAPEEIGEQVRRLDQACAQAGRDPSTIVRTVSPSINLLASPEAFVEGVRAYHAVGIRDVFLPWPRVEAEVPVLREIARNVLPALRGEQTQAKPAYRALTAGDSDAFDRALSGQFRAQAQMLLTWLCAHPDERFDGAALRKATGIATHAEVSEAFAEVREALKTDGIAMPWNEHQRGHLVDAQTAVLLRSMLDGNGDGA